MLFFFFRFESYILKGVVGYIVYIGAVPAAPSRRAFSTARIFPMKPPFFEPFSLAGHREPRRCTRFTAREIPKTRAPSALCGEEGKPESGLSLFSKKKVRPRFGVRPLVPENLSQKCTGLPLQPPTRTRSARVRCFSFFAFTSSLYDCNRLGNSDLRVNISPLFPSPVKAKKGLFLHPQHTLYQRLAGEGEG